MTRRAAWIAGVTGCAANVLLAVFFAGRRTGFDQPGAAEWAGPANDLVGAVSSAAMVPMALGLLVRLGRPQRLVVATWAAVAAMVVLVAFSVLLLLDLIPFTAQAVASIPAVAVLFGWLVLVGRTGRATGRLRPSLSKAAVAIGAGLLAGTTMVAAAAVLPPGSVAQLVLGGTGVVLGIVAFASYPVWLLRLARFLGAVPATQHPTAPAPDVTQPATHSG